MQLYGERSEAAVEADHQVRLCLFCVGCPLKRILDVRQLSEGQGEGLLAKNVFPGF